VIFLYAELRASLMPTLTKKQAETKGNEFMMALKQRISDGYIEK
jgi:hypothetical protein